jgi:hypothetical protein
MGPGLLTNGLALLALLLLLAPRTPPWAGSRHVLPLSDTTYG